MKSNSLSPVSSPQKTLVEGCSSLSITSPSESTATTPATTAAQRVFHFDHPTFKRLEKDPSERTSFFHAFLTTTIPSDKASLFAGDLSRTTQTPLSREQVLFLQQTQNSFSGSKQDVIENITLAYLRPITQSYSWTTPEGRRGLVGTIGEGSNIWDVVNSSDALFQIAYNEILHAPIENLHSLSGWLQREARPIFCLREALALLEEASKDSERISVIENAVIASCRSADLLKLFRDMTRWEKHNLTTEQKSSLIEYCKSSEDVELHILVSRILFFFGKNTLFKVCRSLDCKKNHEIAQYLPPEIRSSKGWCCVLAETSLFYKEDTELLGILRETLKNHPQSIIKELSSLYQIPDNFLLLSNKERGFFRTGPYILQFLFRFPSSPRKENSYEYMHLFRGCKGLLPSYRPKDNIDQLEKLSFFVEVGRLFALLYTKPMEKKARLGLCPFFYAALSLFSYDELRKERNLTSSLSKEKENQVVQLLMTHLPSQKISLLQILNPESENLIHTAYAIFGIAQGMARSLGREGWNQLCAMTPLELMELIEENSLDSNTEKLYHELDYRFINEELARLLHEPCQGCQKTFSDHLEGNISQNFNDLIRSSSLSTILSRILIKGGYERLFRAIVRSCPQREIVEMTDGFNWAQIEQLLSRMRTMQIDIDYRLWNPILSDLSVNVTEYSNMNFDTGGLIPIAVIEQTQLERDPQGVLESFGKNIGDLKTLGLSVNGTLQPSVDYNGIKKHFMSWALGRILENPTATPSRMLERGSPEWKEAVQKEKSRQSIVNFTKTEDGFVPGIMNYSSKVDEQQAPHVISAIAWCLAACAESNELHSGPFLSERFYAAAQLIKQKPSLGTEEAKKIYETLYPEEKISILSENPSDEELVAAFRRHYSEDTPPKEVGGWNVTQETVAAARMQPSWQEVEQCLREKQWADEASRKWDMLNLYNTMRLLTNKMRALPNWEELRQLPPHKLAERIEGCKEVNLENLVERMDWRVPELTKGWILSWLEQKEDESPRQHKERLESFVEAITGLRSLPPVLKIRHTEDSSRYPQYHTCFDTMACPQYGNESIFIEKLETSLKPEIVNSVQRN